MARFNTDWFPESGLYLFFPDGNTLPLTKVSIERATEIYLQDKHRLPEEVRAAAEYQPCEICPKRHTAEICHAIVVVLPVLEDLDRYMSYDRVTAVYREAGTGMLYVQETALQKALNFLTMLSLLHYCEQGRLFARYFEDVNPLMDAERMAAQVFRNLYVKLGGDLEAIGRQVDVMERNLLVTTHCQIDRLKLICKNDALLNAFVNLHTSVSWLLCDLHEQLDALDTARPV